jgi:hypothetical protein
MIRHIVIFRYKRGAAKDQVLQVTGAFRDLKNNVPGILSFEHGANDSREGKDQGFTHVHQLAFADARSRDAYLTHPAHLRFVERLDRLRIIDDVFVVDYDVQA